MLRLAPIDLSRTYEERYGRAQERRVIARAHEAAADTLEERWKQVMNPLTEPPERGSATFRELKRLRQKAAWHRLAAIELRQSVPEEDPSHARDAPDPDREPCGS